MARRFPQEFRIRAIELVRIGDRPLSQVARELGVSNSAPSRWVAEDDFAKAQAEKASGIVPVLDADEQAKLVRLRWEVRRTGDGERDPQARRGVLREGERAPKTSFRLVEQLTTEDPHRFKVATVSRLLGVSRSGYYTWAEHHVSARKARDEQITAVIARLRAEKGAFFHTYASRRMHAELRIGHGFAIGRKRVERNMRERGWAPQEARQPH